MHAQLGHAHRKLEGVRDGEETTLLLERDGVQQRRFWGADRSPAPVRAAGCSRAREERADSLCWLGNTQ